jgi:site-specific recombinase XerD
MQPLSITTETPTDTELTATVASARQYVAQAKAPHTIRAYRADWQNFTAWCQAHALISLPAQPETVGLYIAALADAGRKPATIQRRLAAISKAHSAAGHESPASLQHAVVSEVWKGVKRAKGTAQAAKSPVITDELRRMLACLPDTLPGVRDRALLLMGFAGAFRRSELVALDAEDMHDTSEGLIVTLRRSKTDQDGEGRKIGIPYGCAFETCPVRSLRAWTLMAAIETGALFRSISRHGKIGDRLTDQSVALVLKRYAERAGLEVALVAGHSLRAGLATSAAIAGASERSIMQQLGHKSSAMTRRYVRDGSLFRENAAAKVGL